jgi:hypothetical protein
MNRIISWFSCGAASAVATKLTLAKYGNKNVVIARCVVREEHSDNDRFAADCEKWFGHPITNLIASEYNGSVHAVIERRKYISGIQGAPCTTTNHLQAKIVHLASMVGMLETTSWRSRTNTNDQRR